MALMNCPECGNRISDQSKVCIHCGYVLAADAVLPTAGESDTNVQPNPKKTGKKKLIIVAVLLCLIAVSAVIIVAMFNQHEPLNVVGVWKDKTNSSVVTYHYFEDGNVKVYSNSTRIASGTYFVDDDDILHIDFNSGILLEYTNVRGIVGKISIEGDTMTLVEESTNGTSVVSTFKRIE